MRLAGAFLIALAAYAQSPVHVDYKCTADDAQELGLSCTATDPCPVFLELSDFESVASRMLVVGNLHTSTTTVASILLASEDGGKTWTEPHQRMRGAGLDQMQFVDFENGWVSGQIIQSRPRDPFILLTRDGGKTWSVKPVFEESRPGAIEQFWFDSKTDGSMLVDRGRSADTDARHELYESKTGGDTWMLVQASAAPLKLKRARPGAGNTDWRLRADARSKAYHLERKQGERWTTVTQFTIAAGECKPAEVVEPEPEPEPVKAEKKEAETPTAAKPPSTPPTLKKKRPGLN